MPQENDRFIFTDRGMGDIDPGFPASPHLGEAAVGAEAEVNEVPDDLDEAPQTSE